MKDLFIDNNIAVGFTNPVDPSYKQLISWLLTKHADSAENAYLVVSNKLLQEYDSSAKGCFKGSSIPVIISQLTKDGRVKKITNEQIKDFTKAYYTTRIVNRMRCNRKDRDHIPVVLLSERRIALTLDQNFANDLINFPGFGEIIAGSPEQVIYM